MTSEPTEPAFAKATAVKKVGTTSRLQAGNADVLRRGEWILEDT